MWARAKVLPFPPNGALAPEGVPCSGRLARLCFRSQVASRRGRLSIATTSARVTARYPWRSVARRLSHRGRVRVARAGLALGRRRREWLALGAAVSSASAYHARQAGRPFSSALRRGLGRRQVLMRNRHRDSPARATLEPAQRRTLEAGSCIVLSAVGIGFEIGGWPVWSIAAAIGLYCAWVVVYAEVTVQASRGPIMSPRQWWHGPRGSRRLTSRWPASASESQPPHEERTA